MASTTPIHNSSRFGIASFFAIAALLGGCSTPPPPAGATGGRIDPYRSTQADVVSYGASMPALYEFADRAAESLARDLHSIDVIRESPTAVVMELGTIRNQTRTPTGNFEMMQHRLRAELEGSRLLRDHVLFVEEGARMDLERERILGPDGRSLLGDSGPATDRYDPLHTYVLQGTFFESGRANVRRYLFEFSLVNLQTRERIFRETYDLGQTSP